MSMSEAGALRVESIALTPEQIGKTAQVKVGLHVQGWTNTMFLTIAGAFEVRCPQSEKIEAQRASQWSQYPAGFSSTLNIPSILPTQYSIPGWPEWATPSTKGCTFVYVGRAKESLVSIGMLGLSISLGAGEAVDGDTKTFNMVKPVPGTDSGTCNP
jgi:hypothetical protein